MFRLPILPTLGVAALLALPVYLKGQEPTPEAGPATASTQVVAEFVGSFVPSDFRQIQLRPKEYKGALSLREVVKHGALVERDQVIAVLQTKDFEEQLHQAELALDSQNFNFEIDQARAELEEISVDQSLEAAEVAVKNAEQGLQAWVDFQLRFNQAQSEISALYQSHSIEDAQDELDQLEAMYQEDELTDATEEIVLKRSRRNLKRSQISQELADAQREFTAKFNWEKTTEDKQRTLRNAVQRRRHLQQKSRLDAAVRQRRLDLAEHELERAVERLDRLREDGELLRIRAPRSGLLLHGAAEDYRPGKVAPRHIAGANLSPRRTLFTVARPGKFAIAIKIGESQLGLLESGMKGTAESVGSGRKQAMVGKLEIAGYPLPSSAGGAENQYAATLKLGSKVPHVVPGQRAKVSFYPK
jgi:hypothetical protein